MAEKQVKKVRKNPFVGTSIAKAKVEFEARLKAIEPNLVAAIKSGSVHTVDCEIYAVRHLGADTTVEIMQSADSKKVGITNLNKRQLEANTYMLATGMVLLASQANETANTEDALISAEYGVIPAIIANGELEVKNGDKVLYPRNSNQCFATKGGNATASTYGDRMGYRALECPKLISPLTDIVPTLYLPKSADNKLAVKFSLIGVRTNKA